MREPEGIETPRPGQSSERPWSKRREPDIRNVEAEGSSPFTSTRSPRSKGLKWEPPEDDEALLSATWSVVEVEDESLAVARRRIRSHAARRISVTAGGATGCPCLYVSPSTRSGS